jgi:hypothetical protein
MLSIGVMELADVAFFLMMWYNLKTEEVKSTTANVRNLA